MALFLCTLLLTLSRQGLAVGEPTQNLGPHHFSVAKGHQISLALKPGLVDRPISAAFDSQGRLYVTESSGSNEPAAQQAQKKPHRILQLSDSDGDGVFDKRTVFADNLMLPQGIMVFRGEVWVGTPPQIWRLLDTNDDGVADKRTLFHDGGTLTGCMNDLHGPALGPDGRIYWTKGAFAEQKHTIDGKPFVTKACHVFSARPNGSDLQVHMTGGMDNPVGVAFSPLGDLFVSCTFVHHPHLGLRDGIIHPTLGMVFGKDHAPIQDPKHSRTGPGLATPLVEMGPAAPCGLAYFEHPDNDFKDRLACCQFNLKKVSLHALTAKGAGLTADSTDLLVSDYKDFHPTDVIEDADGSLLVVDTGGWYKLCCPSSQMVKEESKGTIYRIRKTKAPSDNKPDPRGLNIAWNSPNTNLGQLLSDRRPMVAKRATEELILRKDTKTLAALARNESLPEGPRMQALWALAQIDDNDSAMALLSFANTGSRNIQLVHLQALIAKGHKESEDKESGHNFLQALQSTDPTIARIGAKGIARFQAAQVMKPLLDRLNLVKGDEVLARALTHALIQLLHGQPNQAAIALSYSAKSQPAARALVLVALDQTGHLSRPDSVWELLQTGGPAIRPTALWILGHHPEWGTQLADSIQKEPKLLGSETLANLASSPKVSQLLGLWASQKEHKDRALKAMAMARLTKVPEAWLEPVAQALKEKDNALAMGVAQSVGGTLPVNWIRQLETIGEDSTRALSIRLQALATLPQGTVWTKETFAVLVSALNRTRTPMERSSALTALVKGRPDLGQLKQITMAIPLASQADMGRILDLFTANKGDAVGLVFVEALNQPEIAEAVAPAMARALLERHALRVREKAQAVLARREPNRAEEAKRLADYFAQLPKGDLARGHIVFNGVKGACAGCHKIGYVGGDTGPDLSRIGQIRSKMDLLESILVPNASFVRSYEPVVVVTKSGRIVTGILQEDGPDGLRIAVGPAAVDRIPREQIEEMTPGKVSVMPAGVEKLLSPQDMADLLEFLLQRK